MSKFAESQNTKTEQRQKESSRREALGKYFYNLSKLTFAGLVLGVVIPLFQDFSNSINFVLLGLGVFFVWFFASVGNKFHQ